MRATLLVLLVAYAYAEPVLPYDSNIIHERVNFHLEPQHLHLKSVSDDVDAIVDDWLARELQTLGVQQRDRISEAIANLLEGFRDIVINGNEDLPPLDPLVIDHLGPFEYTITGVRATLNVNNLMAQGLRWYVVDHVNFNVLRLSLGIHLTLPWLTVSGDYDAEARIALLLTHRAGGNFRVFINRFEVGVDLRLGTNLFGGHLTLRELDIKLDIHDTLIEIDGMFGSSLINGFINALVQNISQDLIQSELQNVSQTLSEELFDIINDILKDYTISDILG